jgi:hypothetical protein
MAELKGTRLYWGHEDAWIEVGDLPTKFIDELKELTMYEAAFMVRLYLEDF